jgi:ABC-2 type transport system ATP-binding protein
MLHFNHVTKLYGTVIGVNDVTVDLGQGAHGLLGPNGAGKTTFIGLVTGQLRPSMGRVEVYGEAPFNNDRVLRRIGYCPAADITERRATPLEWVRYLLRLSGFSVADAAIRAERTLARVGLREAAERPLGTLSKGMRQRAKLAGAIAHEPDLLVLDEPFVGLDPVARHDLVALVRDWALERSLLVASHLLHEIEALHAGLAVILGGRMVASGSVAEIAALVDSLPIELVVHCDDPRRLAARLVGLDACSGLRLEDSGAIAISTRAPDIVSAAVAAAAADGIAVASFVPADRSLEGLFSRLVQLHRGTASS